MFSSKILTLWYLTMTLFCKHDLNTPAVLQIRRGNKDNLPYFFAYKTVFFSFQNNPKNLDPSYKMDLDLWDCLGRVKPVLQQNCIGLI